MRPSELGLQYQLIRPQWGVQFAFTPAAFGKSDIGGSGLHPKGFSLSWQYQPTSIQSLGVFSLGPSISLYPFLPQAPGATNSFYSIWSIGAELRYQARFFREQVLVPVAGLDFEHVIYHLNTVGTGGFNMTGPMLGLNLLLNPLEPSSAFAFYNDSGVLRTYLTGEILLLKGSDQDLNVSGASYFFGIRVEF